MTIVDIARAAGVSIKTVSRVVNREDGVGAATRERVEALIRTLGYRPNVSARALKGARSYLIGLLWGAGPGQGATNHAYMMEAHLGALRACRAAGYHLVIELLADHADVARFAAGADGVRFDGVILSPPMSDDVAVLDLLDAAGLVYARIAPDAALQRSPYVHLDDRAGARQMTARLWEHGHRRIGLIAGPPSHDSSRRRREGYLAALAQRGVTPPADWLVVGRYDVQSGFEAAERLFALPQRPTAIFASNDEMAQGVLTAAQKWGLAVPAALSVAGFDDTPTARAAWPPLSTVRQPVADMAAAAVALLIQQFGDARFRTGQPACEVAFELIERGSVGPPPP